MVDIQFLRVACGPLRGQDGSWLHGWNCPREGILKYAGTSYEDARLLLGGYDFHCGEWLAVQVADVWVEGHIEFFGLRCGHGNTGWYLLAAGAEISLRPGLHVRRIAA